MSGVTVAISLGTSINKSKPNILPSAANNPPGSNDTAPAIDEKETIKTDANIGIFKSMAFSARKMMKPSKDQETIPMRIANKKGFI